MALALMMVLSLAISASAATITVNGVEGKTYDAYKIFDVIWEDKDNDEEQDKGDGYGYSIADNSEWYDLVADYEDLTLTESVTVGTVTYYTVTKNDKFNAADFAKHLLGEGKVNLTGKTVAGTGTIVEDETSVDLTVAEPGYYLVDTTLGSLCILDTAASAVTVKEKNSDTPTADKEVKEDDSTDGEGYGDSNTAQIGQEVEFRSTITVQYNPKGYVLHDTMSAGLTFVENSVEVKVGNDTLTTEEYTLNTNTTHCTFEISFEDKYLQGLAVGTQIVVTYKATLNEEAIIAGSGNTNTIQLDYTNSDSQTGSTTQDTTTTYTYEFDLVKTDDEGNLLSGAEFKLYDAETGGSEIKLVKVGDSYRPAIGEEVGVSIVIPASGTVKISGLDGNTTYYLEETKAPAGYNMLTARQPVSIVNANLNLSADAIDEGKYDSENGGGVQVVNKTGSVLPETGAMGTLMFITFGVVVMMATGVLLVTKKRMTMIQE